MNFQQLLVHYLLLYVGQFKTLIKKYLWLCLWGLFFQKCEEEFRQAKRAGDGDKISQECANKLKEEQEQIKMKTVLVI